MTDLSPLVDEFVYTSLSFSPISATQAGYHEHRGMKLDEMLDDNSPAAIDLQRKFYQDFKKRLDAVKPDQLPPEDRADYDIMTGQIAASLLDLDTSRATGTTRRSMSRRSATRCSSRLCWSTRPSRSGCGRSSRG